MRALSQVYWGHRTIGKAQCGKESKRISITAGSAAKSKSKRIHTTRNMGFVHVKKQLHMTSALLSLALAAWTKSVWITSRFEQHNSYEQMQPPRSVVRCIYIYLFIYIYKLVLQRSIHLRMKYSNRLISALFLHLLPEHVCMPESLTEPALALQKTKVLGLGLQWFSTDALQIPSQTLNWHVARERAKLSKRFLRKVIQPGTPFSAMPMRL